MYRGLSSGEKNLILRELYVPGKPMKLNFIKKSKLLTLDSRAMAPSKQCNSTFKDSVIAQLALNVYFAIVDDHPTDKTGQELAKLMFLHNPNPP